MKNEEQEGRGRGDEIAVSTAQKKCILSPPTVRLFGYTTSLWSF